jgi:hypothetical protein
LFAIMTFSRASVAQRRLSLLALSMIVVQLTGCVMFREPIENPQPTSPGNPPVYPTPNTGPSSEGPAAVPAPSPTSPPPSTAPPVATRQFHLGPASTALVTQAHRQAAGGDPQLAISTIERALRIEPDNPLLWIELGEAHEAAGRYEQAGGMGHKALQLAVGDPQAQSASWRLIADSLKARGRNGEAAEAQRRADGLSPQ